MASYGERFAVYVADYLRHNRLTNADGQPSLGRINRNILADLSDRFEQNERRREQAQRAKKRRKPQEAIQP